MLKGFNLQLSVIDPQSEQFIKDSGTKAIVLWTPQWLDVESVQGQRNMSLFANTDANVAWARHIGLKVLLATATECPSWSFAGRAKSLPNATHQLPPDDLTQHGPWAGWLKLIYKRYPDVLPIVLNEPNLVYWQDPDWGEHTATMMQTAALVAHKAKIKHILGPACTTANATERMLVHLKDWDPPVEVGCALHQYNDVHNGNHADVDGTLEALAKANWKNGRRVWLTEGGLHFATHTLSEPPVADPSTWAYNPPQALQALKQFRNLTKHYRYCESMKPENGIVEGWFNYEVIDSLWGGWASGVFWHDGTPKRMMKRWIKL